MYHLSLKVTGWKRYLCVECGCVYRVRFERWTSAGGYSPEAAQENALRSAVRPFLEEPARNPCPTCGRIPERATAPARFHTQAALLGVGVITVGGPFALGAGDVLSKPAAALAVACMALVMTFCHWLAARRDPNRDCGKHKTKAAQLIQQKRMGVLRAGDAAASPPPPVLTAKHKSRLRGALWAGVLALVPAAAHVLAGPSAVLWWVFVGNAVLMTLFAGLSLTLIESAALTRAPAALVERLDGKDGDVVYLTDDPDDPVPPGEKQRERS